MLQPVMIFRVSVIILLLWTSVPSFAEAARLTFGAAPGATHALDSENQARRLASDLAEALDDDVSVRLFDDQLQLGQWLNQFAMIDLGVMDAAFLAAHPGEFLVLGSADQAEQLFFVARQGTTGDLPRRVAATLRRAGMRPSSPATPPVATITPSAVAERPTVSDKAESATPLVLGLVAGRERVIHSSSQAEQLAVQLGKWLAVPVRARLFDSEQALADWFCRFRMIDFAIIDEPGRRDPLVGDYRPLQRLTAGGGAKGFLVARRDLPEARLGGLAQALTAFGPESNLDELLAAPVAEPAVVVVTPAPIMPAPPQPPVWPEVPVVSPVPEKPVLAVPAPAVPPKPDVRVEPPVSPEAAEPVAAVMPSTPPVSAREEKPALPGILLPPSPFEGFQMPASIGPMGTLDEAPETLPASVAAPVFPESAPPVETVPLPTVVAETPVAIAVKAPAAEIPLVPARQPTEPVVTETAPEAIPELPFTPEPPRVVEEGSSRKPGQKFAVETLAAAPIEEEPVQQVSIAPFEPASIPPAEVVSAAVAEMPPPEAPAVPAPVEPVAVETVPETIPELPFTPVPPRLVEDVPPPVPGQELAQAEVSSPVLEGVTAVPEVIAQPDLPQELRPPGVPLPRPGRLPKAAPPTEEPLLLAKLQEPLGRTPKPPPLLPVPDPEPGVVYVAPFITLMVPTEVRERVFDQFIDTLNQRGAERKLKFVILKQGLDKVDHNWLGARKHVFGEIYGYVEDSGCCSTDLRTRVRLTYYRAHQPEPALKFEYPVRVFFDHDRSNLTVERQKLADQVAAALVDELLKALQP